MKQRPLLVVSVNQTPDSAHGAVGVHTDSTESLAFPSELRVRRELAGQINILLVNIQPVPVCEGRH